MDYFEGLKCIGSGGFSEVYDLKTPFLDDLGNQHKVVAKCTWITTLMGEQPPLPEVVLTYLGGNVIRLQDDTTYCIETKLDRLELLTLQLSCIEPEVMHYLKTLGIPHVPLPIRQYSIISEDRLWLITEMSKEEGKTLQRDPKNPVRLSLDDIARSMLPVVETLKFCATKNITHRDLKPANIIYSRSYSESRTSILDWGSSIYPYVDTLFFKKHILNKEELLSGYLKNLEGIVICSPIYASPEHLVGSCTSQSDLYSLGILIFDLFGALDGLDIKTTAHDPDTCAKSLGKKLIELGYKKSLASALKELLSKTPEKRRLEPLESELLDIHRANNPLPTLSPLTKVSNLFGKVRRSITGASARL